MAMHAPAAGDPAVQLRDELTIERLRGAVEGLPELQILDFDTAWWDGQSHDPCLVVSFGNSGSRRRVIETAGEAVVVPISRRRAARQLAARRAPRRQEIGLPPQRGRADDIAVDAEHDAVRCPSPNCGALRPIDVAGRCPLCGAD